jgi:ATP-dependent Clp protease ATP-binding subunit ClpA
MFNRFTDRARRVLVLAADEARLLKHDYVGTEHLLLGLIGEEQGIAAKALESLGVSHQTVRGKVEEIIGTGFKEVSGQLPFTPRARKVLELSLKEALELGHNYVGTEHLLLGLIREGEGVAATVLIETGLDHDQIREEVLRLLSGTRPKDQSLRSGKLSSSDALALRPGGPIARALEELGIRLEDLKDRVQRVHRQDEVMQWLREGYPIAKAVESYGISLEEFRRRVEEFIQQDDGSSSPDEKESP